MFFLSILQTVLFKIATNVLLFSHIRKYIRCYIAFLHTFRQKVHIFCILSKKNLRV